MMLKGNLLHLFEAAPYFLRMLNDPHQGIQEIGIQGLRTIAQKKMTPITASF